MSAPLTPQREQEIRDREQAATPGPWRRMDDQQTLNRFVSSEGGTLDINFGYVGNRTQDDVAFVAHARDDIPVLLAALDAVRAERDAFRAQRNGVFETNERLLEQIQQEQAARLRAENETRTATREIDELRARVEKTEPALAATGRSLSSFIFDSEDPGADALGAQWLYHQAMPQADDPFAQPRAFRASVFEEAAKVVEELDTYSPGEHRERPQVYLDGVSDGLQAAAERLNKLADQSAMGGAS
ncbi:hypothetical protein [Streptomyces scopuliridis]|uniref:hypothetical protein n=1 Tax=Streptomyces scopuliridis TaxID=452529 RepID=UPI0035DB3CC6